MRQLEARPNTSLQRYWKMRLQDGPLLPVVSCPNSSLTRNETQKLTYDRVGGVVGEYSFKFFVQFVFYAFLYCLFMVVVAAIYLRMRVLPTGLMMPWDLNMRLQHYARNTSRVTQIIRHSSGGVGGAGQSWALIYELQYDKWCPIK
jgi:hypothetical protein